MELKALLTDAPEQSLMPFNFLPADLFIQVSDESETRLFPTTPVPDITLDLPSRTLSKPAPLTSLPP